MGFLKPVSSSISSTRPTTSGPDTCPGRWTPPPSSPSRTKAVSRSSTDVPAGTSTYSASQPMGTRITLPLPGDGRSLLDPECSCEPHVALDDVPHVADARAELQGAFDAHAEGEAGELLRVDAAGDQHPRVDH